MTTLIIAHALAKVLDLHILQSRLSLDPEKHETYLIVVSVFKRIAETQAEIGTLI